METGDGQPDSWKKDAVVKYKGRVVCECLSVTRCTPQEQKAKQNYSSYRRPPIHPPFPPSSTTVRETRLHANDASQFTSKRDSPSTMTYSFDFLPTPRATPTASNKNPYSLAKVFGDKENVAPQVQRDDTLGSSFPLSPAASSSPVKPLQLRASRVIFADKNRHHPYAHKPRSLPNSKLVHPPARSILKRPSLDSTASDLTTPMESPRAPSPEPEAPLQCSDFLSSPVKALVASLAINSTIERLVKPNQHDITEAYSTLGARLRAHFKAGNADLTSDTPALASLKEHAEDLTAAFVRDLSRPAADPGPFSSDSEDDLEAWSDDVPVTSSPLGGNAGKTSKKRGVTAAQIVWARDAFLLTQAAIRTITAILSSAVLSGCFAGESCLIHACRCSALIIRHLRVSFDLHPRCPDLSTIGTKAVHSEWAQDDHARHVGSSAPETSRVRSRRPGPSVRSSFSQSRQRRAWQGRQEGRRKRVPTCTLCSD